MIARAIIPGSARVSRAGFGISPKQSSSGSAGSLPAVFGSLPNTISSASCRRMQAGSLRSPE